MRHPSTLSKILKHWTAPGLPTISDLPFDIEAFCHDMDREMEWRDKLIADPELIIRTREYNRLMNSQL